MVDGLAERRGRKGGVRRGGRNKTESIHTVFDFVNRLDRPDVARIHANRFVVVLLGFRRSNKGNGVEVGIKRSRYI